MYYAHDSNAMLTNRDVFLLLHALAGEHPDGWETRRYELAQRLAAHLNRTAPDWQPAPAKVAARVPCPDWLAKCPPTD